MGELLTQKGMGYLGYYKNGRAHGKFWAGMFGGNPNGHLHGTIRQTDATISGNNISYIYPDMETAFLGKFEDLIMKDAQESAVLGVECDENGLLYVNQYSKPEPSSPHFYYEPATNVSYGAGPPGVPDPYERKWLELRTATNPKMGQGVFMKKDAKKGVFISIYHGLVYRRGIEYQIYLSHCGDNVTKSSNERRHCAKYALSIPPRDATINIPPDYDQPGMFLPTLGPKVCKKTR